jgi:hypothetical protein
MNALKWYAHSDYIRGGRSLEGQQVDVDGEKGTLNSLARWIVTLAERRQRQQDSDEESTEEDEDMTMSGICDQILAFFKAEGVNKKDWFLTKITAARNAGQRQIYNTLWRALKNELGSRDVYEAVFKKTVSVRR